MKTQLFQLSPLGGGLAQHVTKFRDHAVTIINEKIRQINVFIEAKTEFLLAVNKRLAAYTVEDFKTTYVNEERLLKSIEKLIRKRHAV